MEVRLLYKRIDLEHGTIFFVVIECAHIKAGTFTHD